MKIFFKSSLEAGKKENAYGHLIFS
jgi:hypothetical protein